jgi:hypothetical protein
VSTAGICEKEKLNVSTAKDFKPAPGDLQLRKPRSRHKACERMREAFSE